MLELGQLDLEFAFTSAGALGENIQDKRRPIEHLAAKDFFQIAVLGRGKFVVENYGIHIMLTAVAGKFLCLSGADESGSDRLFKLLDAIANQLGACSGGQFGEFSEGILQFDGGTGFEFQANEEDSLSPLRRRFYECLQL